ncbi:MAG: shikimate kinase [Planctomycetes bacterium]|nr:shikimate kinase [Planctomycetota bacterium]
MKIVVLGNAGSGKSTLSRRLAERGSAERLSLDDVAFDGGIERRALRDSVDDVERFLASHASWVIEGCYADIVEAILGDCDELIFLNPGVDACVAHCRARPWEPDKFGSRAEQDAHLENLIEWVRAYEEREDEYGLRRHRALFDAFVGPKHEFVDPREYEAL